MNEEARQLSEIRARLADNYRELGNDEWRGQYRRDVITLLSLLDAQPDGYARAIDAAKGVITMYRDAPMPTPVQELASAIRALAAQPDADTKLRLWSDGTIEVQPVVEEGE